MSIKITALTGRAVKSILFDKLEFVYYIPQIIEATLYKVTTNKNTPNNKK